MKKRVLALFLTLVMAVSVLSVGAFADGHTYDNRDEAIDDTGVTASKTASGPDADGNYTITITVEGSTTTEPGVKNLPADIVLVVDTSTSMNDAVTRKACGGEIKKSIVGYKCANCGQWYSHNQAEKNNYICTEIVTDKTRLDIARAAAGQFASGLMDASDAVRMGVYDFSGSNRTNLALTDNKTAVASAVEGLSTPSGWGADGTDYGLGLSGAADILQDSGEGRQKFVVFISDGEPNNGDYGTEEAQELMNEGVTIMTVGVDMDDSDMKYLSAISSEDKSGIKYCFAASSDGSSGAALDTVLALIQEKIETSINSGTGAVLTDTINTEAFTLVEGSQSAVLTVNENVLTWNIGDIGSGEQKVSFKVKPVEGKYGELYTNSDVSLSFYSTQQSANVTFNKGAIGDPTVTIEKPTAGYTVNYYKDSLDSEPFKTETGEGDIGAVIPYDADGNKPEGYKFDSVTPENPTISSEIDNVVSVLYVKDDTITKELSYTVEYYKDGVKADTDTVTENVWIGLDQSTLTVKKAEINCTDKYEGYAFDRTEPVEIPDTIADKGVIKVYYGKDDNSDNIPDKYQVTVTYDVVNGTWSDGGTEQKSELLTLKTNGVWDENGTAEANVPEVKPNTGYTAGKWEPDSMVVTKDSDHSFVYTFFKDSGNTKQLNYTIQYVSEDGRVLYTVYKTVYIWAGDSTYTVEKVEIKEFDNYTYANKTEPTLPATVSEGDVLKVFYTSTGPDKPEFDDIDGIFDGQVYVDCISRSWHKTMEYGLLESGFTAAEPVKGADGKYTCTVTLLASAYLAEYNDDTGSKHYLEDDQKNIDVVLKWNEQKDEWVVINGELPVTFEVVCDDYVPPVIPPVDPVTPDYKPSWLNTTDHFAYIIGYEDGTIKPDAGITRAEVATIFFRLLTDEARESFWRDTNPYSDVAPDSWYNNAVSTLSGMGILGGYEDGTFRPNAPITRAEFAKIAVSFFDWESIRAQNGFTDVSDRAWYAEYVAAAAELGLIEGYGGGLFRPEANITRAEACAIINRTLGRVPDEDHLLPVTQMNTWPDNSDTGVWYYAQIQEATNSHDYRWIGSVEQWTEKLADPDWDKLQ